DVSVSAGNDVRTDSGEETQRDDVYQYSKKSGLMGAGIGFTIGSKKVTDTTDGRYKNQVATNISSSKDEINVSAGNSIHSTTTNYFSNKPIDLSAQNVTVDGKHNTAHVVQSHEEKRSGLTVSVGGQIVNELNAVQQLGKRANSRKNSNLSTLEYLEAANTLKHAYNDGTSYKNAKIEKLVEKEKDILAKADELNKAYQAEHPEESNAMHPDVRTAINNVNNRIKKDRLLNIQVGIGSSKFKQHSELNQENYIGSSIGSKNNVSITADSDNSDKGNIHIKGSIVEAPKVNLNASNNLSIDAGTNSLVQRDTYTSSGWSVGATVSPHGNGVIGLDANVYKGKENALETTKTHTGTVIRGKQVNTVSGNDTEIIGSKVIGESVTTKVGHNLNIESLQDTNDYHKISKNKGISVSYGMSGPVRVGFDNSRGTTDSHYASVTDQAGIYAGDGGYNVQVNNATTLTGGIIKGSPDKSKNKLSSNSLKMNDIQNKASYSAKTSGYSLSTTKRSKNNPIGITGSPKMGIPVKGNSKSTTHSAISEGIIEIAEKESLEKINHDTEQALNKLAPIFDKKTVEEKQILLSKISDHGYKLIGDIAVSEQKKYVILAESAENANNEKLAKEYLDKAKKWDDGGIYKVALHGALGATISKLSGYDSFNGFKISAINEVTQPLLRKIDNPDMQKLVSIILGKSISDQSIAVPLINSAVDNNWLTHDDQLNLLRDYRSFKYGEISLDEWVRKLAYYDTLMWYEYNHNSIYKTNNETSILLNGELESSIPEVIGSGSFQDIMNNLVYKYVTSNGLEDSFSMYKQEASSRIVSSNKAYEDSLLNDYIDKYGVEKGRALYGYEKQKRDRINNNSINNLTLSVDKDILYNNHTSTTKIFDYNLNSNNPNDTIEVSKPTNSISTRDLEKSVLTNTTSELTNQPLKGYLYYTENAKPAFRVVNRLGGVFSIGSMTNDFVQDYYTYSGTNLVKAWGTNLIPPIGSAIGGAYGTAEGFKLGYPYGPIATAVSSYSLGTLGSISGGIAGDIKKMELRQDIPTDEEIRKRGENNK
ncbi:MAG: hemagglutinin repeat-containing protein, partial [Veillonella sp.]|nr:hemagglutinin repeat-containing protein [Veillonella sp.]